MEEFYSQTKKGQQFEREIDNYRAGVEKGEISKQSANWLVIGFILNKVISNVHGRLGKGAIRREVVNIEIWNLRKAIETKREKMLQNGESVNDKELKAKEEKKKQIINDAIDSKSVDKIISDMNYEIIVRTEGVLRKNQGTIKNPQEIAIIITDVADLIVKEYRSDYKNLKKNSDASVKRKREYLSRKRQQTKEVEENGGSCGKGVYLKRRDAGLNKNNQRVEKFKQQKVYYKYTKWRVTDIYAKVVGKIIESPAENVVIKQGFASIVNIMNNGEFPKEERISLERLSREIKEEKGKEEKVVFDQKPFFQQETEILTK